MRAGAIAGGFVALAVAVWVVSRIPMAGLRADPSGARVLDGAITFFETKLAADTIDFRAATALAGRYVLRFQRVANLEDLERAEAVIDRTLAFAADPAGAHAQLSSVRLMQHDFAGAYAAARDALAAGSTDDARAALFDAALATGRFAEARNALSGMDRRSLATRVRRSHWLDAKGDSDGAFEALRDVCEQLDRANDRLDASAWCLTELAGLEIGRSGTESARRLYRHALRIMPDYRGAIEGLADLDHAQHNWQRAVERYESIATDAHPDLYLRLAEANRGLGRDTVAVRWEAEFVRAAGAPEVESLYAHPLALFWADRPHARDRALAIARRDVARRPAPESWDVLAWVHLRRDELYEALAASDQAMRQAAPSPTALYRRARILHALGQVDSAGALLREVIAHKILLDPDARVDLDRYLSDS